MKQFNDAIATSKFEGRELLKEIKWHFQPPAAPSWGGVFERLVGMTKRVFKGMSGTQPYNEDVFRTVLAKAVGIMNRRPLTEITSDPNDFRALSPNDFLDPLSNDIRFQEVIPPLLVERPSVRIWKQSRDRQYQFWVRWVREYVSLLQTREKWEKPVANLKVGELVFIMDDSHPRTAWPMCRIEKVFPGEDGMVRRVLVRTPLGRQLVRDRQKIVRLEVRGGDDVDGGVPAGEALVQVSKDAQLFRGAASAAPELPERNSASPDQAASSSVCRSSRIANQVAI